MEKPQDQYWRMRLSELQKVMEENNFQVYVAENSEMARDIVLNKILPETGARSVSWGGSITFGSTGVYDAVKKVSGLEILDTYNKGLSGEDALELRRKALLADLFITGTNAVTDSGQLVNLDMYGNRVAAITFGPKYVIILIGRNKIVPDLDWAMYRIKNYSAPVNSMRLDKKTPCIKTSFCEECKSPDRICNTWTITEKSFPKGRIKIVLINEDLGL